MSLPVWTANNNDCDLSVQYHSSCCGMGLVYSSGTPGSFIYRFGPAGGLSRVLGAPGAGEPFKPGLTPTDAVWCGVAQLGSRLGDAWSGKTLWLCADDLGRGLMDPGRVTGHSASRP